MSCIFTAISNGIADFVVGSGTSPGTLNATDGKAYRYYAASIDGTQWEGGSGAWHNGTSTLQRTAVVANSDGTLTPCNFLKSPLVTVFPSSTQLLELVAVLPPPGNLVGLALSTAGGSSSFGIASGLATDSTYAVSMNLASAFTKTTAAWALGSGNGALDTGSIAASTWYHVHLIQRVDTSVEDVLISLSATAPTLPTNYTVFRRIGSLLTDASSHWVAIFQAGDEVIYANNFVDLNVSIPNDSAQLTTLTVPPGVTVEALFHATLVAGTSAIAVVISSPNETSVSAGALLGGFNLSLAATTTKNDSGDFRRRVNTSGQISWITNLTWTGGPAFFIYTYGYVDRRGRDG